MGKTPLRDFLFHDNEHPIGLTGDSENSLLKLLLCPHSILMQLLIGTLIDTPNLGSLRVRREHLVGAQSRPVTRSIPTYIYLPFRTHTTGTDQDGFINHLQPLTHPSSVSLLGTKPPHEVIYLEPHSFLLPSFTDLHLHAPQYLYAGTGLDLPLMEWLDRYAYRAEERIDQDEELARRVYTTLVKRLVEVGTGCVVLFGTIGVEAKWVRARFLVQGGRCV